MLTITLRKALVIPTALTLALGGALLAAGPASAAPTALTVTSATTAPTTYTATFAGKTAPNVQVELIYPQDPAHPYDVETSDATGAWSLSKHFTNMDTITQQVRIVSDPTGADETQDETVTLPAIRISTPLAGAQLYAGTPFQVAGTAPIGSTMNILVASKLFPTTVDSTGHFTATVTEPVGPTLDSIQAQGRTTAGEDLNDPTITVSVAPALSTLKVLTPTNGFVSTRRSVDFTGTGSSGDVLGFAANGVPLTDIVKTVVAPDGTWNATLVFDPADVNAEAVTVTQPADNGSITVNVTIPTAPVVLAPVIVKPTAGSSSGVQVTYSGTSQPGTYVSVLTLPTPLVAALTAADNNTATPAQQAAADAYDPSQYPPTAYVLVDTQGNWSVTQTLTPGDWTAVAVDEANADGTPPNEDTFSDNAAASDTREFTVTAPAAVTTAATGTTTTPVVAAAAKPATLAFTGSNDGPLYGVAGFLLLAGAGLVVAARRRRALQD